MHRNLKPLTRIAHEQLSGLLQPGDLAVDATAGNGHDTLFLARTVGEAGHVWAFDIQTAALDATRKRLDEAGVADRATLIQDGHQHLDRHLPDHARGRIRAVTFNLGYLPGGDHGIITRPETSLAALEAARAVLGPDGVISLMIYRGHSGGLEEFEAIRTWLKQAHPELHCLPHQPAGDDGPVLVLLGNSLPCPDC
ncbi:16S rRNA (cytosine(1402)-N(4))-methyltransferase [Ectothiorhodospira shaposhnikovii]|uniref:class I SAM-dependent methyltransferase n=1 Tax=Ectothiorhodospira shaposhnikovii TaxID=1054 RepID=UPI0019053A3E|nr:class I SAM-dependent methyltransferase [Ectothiorhodospira shaposhnikovii]MBK1672969.1 16S rRNA (cytosine(1402)-N(4))-methyltransferase [Ectothiorhodospira shaposhnikovii]